MGEKEQKSRCFGEKSSDFKDFDSIFAENLVKTANFWINWPFWPLFGIPRG
jgi:hypothetical protein